MDYFEWFNVARRFEIDQTALRKAFLTKSMELHPDKSTFDSDKQLELSGYNNLAYTTLKDNDKRFEYILTLEQIIISGEKPTLPQEFLMEMLEMNMEIDDAKQNKDDSILEKIKLVISQKKSEAVGSIQGIMNQYDNGQIVETDLLKLKKYYYLSKYLLRIEESIYTFASH